MEGKTGVTKQGSSLAFSDVNVIPMDRNQILWRQKVVVTEGRITGVGDVSQVRIPDGSFKIDGRNRFLMPGLADMHTHTWSEADLLLFLANGVTTIRNMWGSHRQLSWRARIARGEMLGPTIYTAGPLVDGSPPIWNTSKVVVSGEEAQEEVAREKELGYDFVKVYNRLTSEAYRSIVKAAKSGGMKVAGHVPYEVGLASALEAGQDSIEHLEGYIFAIQADDSPVKDKPSDTASRRKAIDFLDERKIPKIVAATLASRAWNCVTLVVTQKFVSAEDAKKFLEDPKMRFVLPEWLASWDPSKDFRLKTMTAEDFQRARKSDAIKRVLTGELHRAGCKILLGTDTPNPFVIPGFSIHEELRNLTDAGLSPYDAIRAGTADAAEFLGASAEFGTVEVGKRADLVLLERNPLEDVTAVSNPLGVMVRGRWYSRYELERMLEEQVSSYATREDRLDPQFQELPGKYHSSYLIKSSNTLLGKERIHLQEKQERIIINSQALMSAPPRVNNYLLRLELDRNWAPVSLSFEGRTSEGTAAASIGLGEGMVRMTATQAEQADLRIEKSQPRGVLLGTPHIASYIPLLNRLGAMEAGQTLDVNMLRLETEPDIDLVEARLQFVRKPDAEVDRRGGPPLKLMTFSLTENRTNATIVSSLLLDDFGKLRLFEREEQMGLTRFELVINP